MAKYTVGYYYNSKCEKCGNELPIRHVHSLYFSESVFKFIILGPKTSKCLNCQYPYKNNNQEFVELRKFEKSLYLFGFVMVPDLQGIENLHSGRVGFFSFIFHYYFIIAFYWFYFLVVNIFFLFPLRIVIHKIKSKRSIKRTLATNSPEQNLDSQFKFRKSTYLALFYSIYALLFFASIPFYSEEIPMLTAMMFLLIPIINYFVSI